MEKIIAYVSSAEFVISVLIIAVAIVVIGLINRISKQYKVKMNAAKKTKNVYLVNGVRTFKLVVIILATVTVLQINGVNVTSLVAGLGLASAIIGLALQDILKDVIMGTHIVSDNFFTVGDAVKYGAFEGIVVDFNMKNTKIKSIENGEVITVCNRNIMEITVMSDVNDIEVPLSYDEDVDFVNEVLSKTCDEIKTIEKVENCVYEGTEEFCDSSIKYAIRFWCKPEFRRETKLKVIQTVQKNLNKNNIKIPYNQIDVHNI